MVGGDIDGDCEPKVHFLNSKVNGMNKSVNQIWGSGCVWVPMVDELWKHRNKKIFNSGKIDHIKNFTIYGGTEDLVMGKFQSLWSMFFVF